jgi:CRISPR-associated protein Csb2
LDAEQRAVLGQIVTHLTYLGRAESLCDARLLDPEADISAPNAAPVSFHGPRPDGESIRLLVPNRPLVLDDLCVRLEVLRSDRKRRSVLPPSSSYVTYRRPIEPPVRTAGRSRSRPTKPVTAVRFLLASAGPGRRAVRPPLEQAILYTSILRAACQSAYGKPGGRRPSPTLSGRLDSTRTSGHGHAHYLALPAQVGEAKPAAGLVGGRRIEALLVWAPDGFDPDEVRALLDVRRLFGAEWITEFRPAGLVVEGFGPSDLVLPELARPSSTFESITPVLPGTHPRRDIGWTAHVEREVRFSLSERDMPQPVSVDAQPVARGFRTQRPSIGMQNRQPHRALNHPHHVRIEFPEAVPGPLCVGALSHFGLGLFSPTSSVPRGH